MHATRPLSLAHHWRGVNPSLVREGKGATKCPAQGPRSLHTLGIELSGGLLISHPLRYFFQDGKLFVQTCSDLSDSGHGASMHLNPPLFVPDAINGCAAFEFDGAR